jgi:hypothetical protein
MLKRYNAAELSRPENRMQDKFPNIGSRSGSRILNIQTYTVYKHMASLFKYAINGYVLY